LKLQYSSTAGVSFANAWPLEELPKKLELIVLKELENILILGGEA
jgi:hypothetical protein